MTTGAHRVHLPHSELCGVERAYANFNAGRARQWWSPSAQVIATDCLLIATDCLLIATDCQWWSPSAQVIATD